MCSSQTTHDGETKKSSFVLNNLFFNKNNSSTPHTLVFRSALMKTNAVDKNPRRRPSVVFSI